MTESGKGKGERPVLKLLLPFRKEMGVEMESR